MKKVAVICVLSLFALLIVLPITSSVNQAVGNPVLNNGTLRADGTPGPGLPPKKQLHSTSTSLVADGTPGPGLPPKKQLHSASTSLVADGTPGPGLPPKKQLHSASSSLVVDGTPGPGLPPKKQRSAGVAVFVSV